MAQARMIRGIQWQLTHAVAVGLRVDPEKQALVGANADRNLLLRRLRQVGVDDVDVAKVHSTP